MIEMRSFNHLQPALRRIDQRSVIDEGEQKCPAVS